MNKLSWCWLASEANTCLERYSIRLSSCWRCAFFRCRIWRATSARLSRLLHSERSVRRQCVLEWPTGRSRKAHSRNKARCGWGACWAPSTWRKTVYGRELYSGSARRQHTPEAAQDPLETLAPYCCTCNMVTLAISVMFNMGPWVSFRIARRLLQVVHKHHVRALQEPVATTMESTGHGQYRHH